MATKKKLELTTSLVSMWGMFCTYHGWANPDYILHEDMIGQDFKNRESDIHPDYYFLHFDNEEYMKVINERTHIFMDEFLTDLLKDELYIDIEYIGQGYNCPKEYNFRGDRHDFDVIADSFQPLVDYCVEHEDFTEFLKDRYSSRDGFISFTSNNTEDILNDIENDEMAAWGAMFSFFIQENSDTSDLAYNVQEALSQDMYYSDFVDYTELDEFMEDLNKGDMSMLYLESTWRKALFERHLGSIDLINSLVQNNYIKKSEDKLVEMVIKELDLDEEFHTEIVQKSVRSVIREIESHTLKLEL